MFHEEMKFGSLSFPVSLDTHLWLLSAATFPTNLQREGEEITFFPAQKETEKDDNVREVWLKSDPSP